MSYQSDNDEVNFRPGVLVPKFEIPDEDDEVFVQSPVMPIPNAKFTNLNKVLSPPNFMVEKILEDEKEEKEEKDEKDEKEEKEEKLQNLENFTYVIFFDVNDEYYNNVLYVDFLKYKDLYFKNLKIINVQLYPELDKYSYENKLLVLKVLDVESVFNIIDYNHFQLENLCKQIISIDKSVPDNNIILKSLLKKISHLFEEYEIPEKRKRITKYLLNGSYQDDKKDDKKDDSKDDNKSVHPRNNDQEIKLIGKYINYSLYYMRFIYKIPDDLIALCKKAYNILKNKFRTQKIFNNLTNIISRSSFISVLNDISLKDIEIVEKLFAVELGDICRNIDINDKSPFIFKNNNTSYENILRYYVGDYLDELDLSKSFITGSAITSAMFNRRTSHFSKGKNFNVDNHMIDFKNTDEDYNKKLVIDLLYPKIYTIMSDTEKRLILDNNYVNWKIKVIGDENGKVDINNIKGKAKLGSKSIYFDIKSGADVDIGINTTDDIEYENIVYKHYNTIKKYYPYNENGESFIKIRQIAVKNGWNYSIYTDNAKYIPIFRTVELYKSNLRNICSHHMSCVRGCYTSVYGERQFLYTASCLYSMLTYESPNLYYFLGIKSKPQDIINKYYQRGIVLTPELGSKLYKLIDYMKEYNLKNDIVISTNILQSRNIPFSIFNNWDVANNLYLLKMPQVKYYKTPNDDNLNASDLIKTHIKNSIGNIEQSIISKSPKNIQTLIPKNTPKKSSGSIVRPRIRPLGSPVFQMQSPAFLEPIPSPQQLSPQQSPLFQPQQLLPQFEQQQLSPQQSPLFQPPQFQPQFQPQQLLQQRSPLFQPPQFQPPQLQQSPLAQSPIGQSPIAQSPIGQSPLAQSPLAQQFQVGQSPILRQQFPLRRQ